jgi:hypothetical protein
MKAIFDFAVAAGRLVRAESGGEALCDRAVRSETVRRATPTRATSATTAPFAGVRISFLL